MSSIRDVNFGRRPPGGRRRSIAGMSAVARAGPRDPSRSSSRAAPDRGQRDRPRDRSHAQHGAPLRRDARHARLPAAGSREQAYRLGPRVLDLGFSAINSMEVREISAPHLQQLSDETGHTVNMAILDAGDIVYIERCRSLAPGPARDRPQPARRLAPARLLHVDGQGDARVPARGRSWPRSSTHRVAERGPNTLTDAAAFLRRARPRSRDRARGQQRGAGLRPALDRRADSARAAARWWRRSTWPCTARWA